jgi:hypothetical protein
VRPDILNNKLDNIPDLPAGQTSSDFIMQDLMHKVSTTILYNYRFVIICHNIYTNGDVVIMYCIIYDLKKAMAWRCLVVCVGAP